MKKLLFICAAFFFTGCSHVEMVTSVRSEQYDQRVRFIVIHTTQGGFAKSMDVLTTERPVSAHYLIPELGDKSYPHDKIKIYQLVPENGRAWHAGVSAWGDRDNINDHSIGIELVYVPTCADDLSIGETAVWNPALIESLRTSGASSCLYPDFDPKQIEALKGLIKDILKRYPDITPENIVAHSDIAPSRKIDPGPRFPWQQLYQAGIGAWYNPAKAVCYGEYFRVHPPTINEYQQRLAEYGYKIERTGMIDDQSEDVIRAFQMHFRPWLVTGEMDAQSMGILYALLSSYRPGALNGVEDLCSAATDDRQDDLRLP